MWYMYTCGRLLHVLDRHCRRLFPHTDKKMERLQLIIVKGSSGTLQKPPEILKLGY